MKTLPLKQAYKFAAKNSLEREAEAIRRGGSVTVNGKDYALDFAFYCVKGKLDVETDGDRWHGERARIPEDNRRDNDLETGGWKLLRFNSHVLNEQMTEYCIPEIVKNIQRLGGIDEGRMVPRDISTDPSRPKQMGLFDD